MLFITVVSLAVKVSLLKWRRARRLRGDRDGGVICLSGAGEMGEEDEDGADDDCRANFHKCLFFIGAFFEKSARSLSLEAV